MLWGTWRIFVDWPTGQLIDDAAWQGSQFGRRHLDGFVEPVVRVISEPFLVLAAVAAFIVAASQRRWSIAIAATVMLGWANLSTQLLKEQALDRPECRFAQQPVDSLATVHRTAPS